MHGIETLNGAQEAAAELSAKIDYVIPGRSPGGTASTVVDVTGETPRLLRSGPIGEIELNFDA
jgi:tRNA A37 threonylcarbamoyladenosine synthetase subunit TsaC/SUA5/YrdC